MKPSVITIIKGGLGNQLFIYSAARALALRTGRELYLDGRRGYVADSYGRSYRLPRFPVAAKEMPEEWRVAPTLRHPRHKIVRAFNKCLPRDWRGYYAQRWNRDARQLTELEPRRNRITLHGYWADPAYFAGYESYCRAELQPPAPADERNRALGEQFSHPDTVFLHARRVRYNTLLEPSYYAEAIRIVRGRVPNPRFAVFGDDVAWVMANVDFGGAPVQIVDHNTDDELADLWLMSRCRHAIVANSSFSWWGAFLGAGGPVEGRCIVAPDHPRWIIRPQPSWHLLPFNYQE